jgi:uroporphyrinogen decarboxylase
MSLERLKRDFRNKLTFWGGRCDTWVILPEASPSEVAEHVRRQPAVFGKEGGWVFQQVHNVPANVPPANIPAMFEIVRSL